MVIQRISSAAPPSTTHLPSSAQPAKQTATPAAAAAATAPRRRPSTAALLLLSGVLQVALLGYAAHVDANPVGGLKYTDVDWRVVADGLTHTAHPEIAGPAQGWLTAALSLPLGSPYARATFRYTPLLVLVLSPALIAPVLGRLVLVALTLALPPLILSGPAPGDFWTTHLLWTLNPIVLNITTRGSPEALACLLTAALVVALRRAGLGNPAAKTAAGGTAGAYWEAVSAALLAVATSYKVFPVIYVAAIWTALAREHGWFGYRVWRFGVVAAATALVLNFTLWSFWGQPFLEHTYLYHLSRLDHRHNFSPYFLPIYLSLTGGDASVDSPWLSALLNVLRNPLASFLPQVSLVIIAGVALTRAVGIEAAMFFQTALFVAFNKVCTSQYFLWPLPLVPLLSLPSLTWRTLAIALVAWIGGQALWLATAYRLEFLGEPVYIQLWGAGLLLFAASVGGIGALLDGALPRDK